MAWSPIPPSGVHTPAQTRYCTSCCMDVAEGRVWISGNTVNRTDGVAHELLGGNKVPSDALSQRKPWQVTVLAVCGKEEGLGSPAAVRGTAGCGCWRPGCARSAGHPQDVFGGEDTTTGARGHGLPQHPTHSVYSAQHCPMAAPSHSRGK